MQIILWNVWMFYQFFLQPIVKRSPIVGNKQGVYELPDVLSNDLRLRITENKEKYGESLNLLEL